MLANHDSLIRVLEVLRFELQSVESQTRKIHTRMGLLQEQIRVLAEHSVTDETVAGRDPSQRERGYS